MGKVEQGFIAILFLVIIVAGFIILTGEGEQDNGDGHKFQMLEGYNYTLSDEISANVLVENSTDTDKEIFIVAEHEESIYVVDTEGRLLREIRISGESRSVVINNIKIINDELWIFGDFVSFISDEENILLVILDPLSGEILRTIGHKEHVDTFGACQVENEVLIYAINNDVSPPKLLRAYQDEKDDYWIVAEEFIEYLGREIEIVCHNRDMYILSIGGLWRINMETGEQELVAYADFDQLQEVDVNTRGEVYMMTTKNASASLVYTVKSDNDRILVYNFSEVASMGIIDNQLFVVVNDSLYHFDKNELRFIQGMQKGVLPSSLFVIDNKYIIYRDTLYNLKNNQSYFIGYYDPHPFFGVKSVSAN